MTFRPQRKLKRISTVIADRQRQMMRLMKRYSTLIEEPTAWILPYSWNIGYIDLLEPGELQYQEFVCNTNNVVFAAMIFEAQQLQLGKKITIAQMDFNNLVKPQ